MFMILLIAILAFVMTVPAWVTGKGLDRMSLSTRDTQGLIGGSSPFERFFGGHCANRVATVLSVDTQIYKSEYFPTDSLGLDFNFVLDIWGTISSDSTDDATIDINVIEPDGTSVTLCTVTTVALADEDDKDYHLKIIGRVTLEQSGATSGKIAAFAVMNVRQVTPLVFSGGSAIAGVSADFRNGLALEVTCNWDDDSADTDMFVVAAVGSACNRSGNV